MASPDHAPVAPSLSRLRSPRGDGAPRVSPVRVRDPGLDFDETDPTDLLTMADWLDSRGMAGAARISRRIADEIERDREEAWG